MGKYLNSVNLHPCLHHVLMWERIAALLVFGKGKSLRGILSSNEDLQSS